MMIYDDDHDDDDDEDDDCKYGATSGLAGTCWNVTKWHACHKKIVGFVGWLFIDGLMFLFRAGLKSI